MKVVIWWRCRDKIKKKFPNCVYCRGWTFVDYWKCERMFTKIVVCCLTRDINHKEKYENKRHFVTSIRYIWTSSIAVFPSLLSFCLLTKWNKYHDCEIFNIVNLRKNNLSYMRIWERRGEKVKDDEKMKIIFFVRFVACQVTTRAWLSTKSKEECRDSSSQVHSLPNSLKIYSEMMLKS